MTDDQAAIERAAEAERRWPSALDGDETTYPRSVVRQFSRAAFITGAEWATPAPATATREALDVAALTRRLPADTWDVFAWIRAQTPVPATVDDADVKRILNAVLAAARAGGDGEVRFVGLDSDGHLCTMCGITHDRFPAPVAVTREALDALWAHRLDVDDFRASEPDEDGSQHAEYPCGCGEWFDSDDSDAWAAHVLAALGAPTTDEEAGR